MRVGLLVDDQKIDRWKSDAIQHLLSDSDAEITIVVENMESTGVDFYLNQVVKNKVWSINQSIRLLKQKLNRGPTYRDPVDLSKITQNEDLEFRRCKPVSNKGVGGELPSNIVDEISAKTDVVVRFGFGIITGDILTAPEYGVLSYHHGDIRSYRGRPAGFWEFMNDEKFAGITVQQLTEVLDGGRIAAEKSVDISNAQTWQEVKKRLFAQSDDLLSEAIDNVSSGEITQLEEVGALYSSPNTFEYGRYLLKNWLQ